MDKNKAKGNNCSDNKGFFGGGSIFGGIDAVTMCRNAELTKQRCNEQANSRDQNRGIRGTEGNECLGLTGCNEGT